MPRVKLIHIGSDQWIAPIAKFGQCEHPRTHLRFDSRFSLPVAVYCTACGQAYLHPFHGMTEQEIADHKAFVERKYAWWFQEEPA